MLYHPLLVHFPIAFYFLELLLLGMWAFKNEAEYRRFALFVFRLGYLFMLAAMLSGYVDAGARFPPLRPVRPHFFAAFSVFVLYTIRAVYWRRAKEEQKSYRAVLILGALLGNALVALAGFLGGKLVYTG